MLLVAESSLAHSSRRPGLGGEIVELPAGIGEKQLDAEIPVARPKVELVNVVVKPGIDDGVEPVGADIRLHFRADETYQPLLPLA